MKGVVLGCGHMGQVAVADLARYGRFSRLVVGSRSADRARSRLNGCCGGTVEVMELDVQDERALRRLLEDAQVAVNCTGPNFRHELSVARAAIAEGVPLVDLNDDYETTPLMLELDEAARDRRVTVIVGLGASPGLNNVLVRAAANQLDEVEEIHTAWVMSAADPGGPALAEHLLQSLSDRALTVEEGRQVEVLSFRDGRERMEFPDPVGELDVFHVGHPEPLTLSRTFPTARVVDDKATFVPSVVNEWIVELGRDARISRPEQGISPIAGRAMEAAAAELLRRCRSLAGVPREGALRVAVVGQKRGRRQRAVFTCSGRITTGTGIPAAAGAILLAEGRVDVHGVMPPEACLDANELLYELFQRRKAGTLNGWVEAA